MCPQSINSNIPIVMPPQTHNPYTNIFNEVPLLETSKPSILTKRKRNVNVITSGAPSRKLHRKSSVNETEQKILLLKSKLRRRVKDAADRGMDPSEQWYLQLQILKQEKKDVLSKICKYLKLKVLKPMDGESRGCKSCLARTILRYFGDLSNIN
eukprot:519732_1